MNLKSAFQDSERAVSPVIGVILMVAITVILAAVIGTFVLGLGDSLGDSQPTAQFNLDVDDTNTQVTISHNGGDSVNTGDIEIVAYNNSAVHSNADARVGVDTVVSTDELTVGDAVNIGYTSTGGDAVDRIRIIHTPSDSILLNRPVDDIDEFDGWTTA